MHKIIETIAWGLECSYFSKETQWWHRSYPADGTKQLKLQMAIVDTGKMELNWIPFSLVERYIVLWLWIPGTAIKANIQKLMKLVLAEMSNVPMLQCWKMGRGGSEGAISNMLAKQNIHIDKPLQRASSSLHTSLWNESLLKSVLLIPYSQPYLLSSPSPIAFSPVTID